MSNQPKLTYKRNVCLTDEIYVSMPAADWVTFIAWFTSHDTDGINFLVIPLITEQLFPKLFDAPSLKAAEAYQNDRPASLIDVIARHFSAGSAITEMEGPFVVTCDTCGSQDEYLEVPMGELTCGHNGLRHMTREED